MFEELIPDEVLSKRAMTMYRISKDMEHASGYNFNASPGLVNISAHEVICLAYRLLSEDLMAAEHALSENGKKIDVKNELRFFSKLSKAHIEAIKAINKDVMQKMDSWLSSQNQ